MRKIIAFILFAAITFFACKTKSKTENFASKYLNANNLQEQSFNINIKKDTTVKTQQGIVVKIAAGSIESATQNVTLQIKEALELEDILQAGLTTQTKDGILSSDGMFYIQTKEESKIIKPLQIELPTEVVDDKMQLYKGVEEDGKIVWQEPKKIETPEPIGKNLFIKNCASCHAVDKKLTGPALANVEERWGKKADLILYIKNNGYFMQDYRHKISDTTISDSSNIESLEKIGYNLAMESERGGIHLWRIDTAKELDIAYAKFLFCKYNKSGMNIFEGILNDVEINQILDYIKNESKSSSTKPTYRKEFDSCAYYAIVEKNLRLKKHDLVVDNGAMVETKGMTPTTDIFPTIAPPKVEIKKYNAEYYKFKIDAYGWYNVDMLLNNSNNVESKLSVTIRKTATQKFETFLIIPSLKIFAEGGLLDDGKSYGFYGQDGMIYLPQEADAYVLAVGEENEKTFFGLEHFTTSKSQNIDIKIEETSKEKIVRKMKRLRLDNFELKIEPTKNFNEVKMVDTELKRIEDKLKKDCGCLFSGDK